MADTQSFLIIARSTPYGNHLARAAIDLALTAAAFEQQVSLVFTDEGVLQLKGSQDTEASDQKNVGKMLGALELYEVQNIYMHDESAIRFGLTPQNCLLDAPLLDDAKLKSLVAQADQVMVF